MTTKQWLQVEGGLDKIQEIHEHIKSDLDLEPLLCGHKRSILSFTSLLKQVIKTLFTFCSFCFPACKAKVDLGFLLDASGSVEMYGKGNFKRMKDFIKMVAEEFVISRRGTHVGVVVYATRAVSAFGFKRYYSRKSVFRAIDRIRYLRGGTRTGLALRRARRFLYNRRTPRRKVLVIMTDGITYDDIKKPTRQLHRMGVETYALGIGLKYSKRQLLLMATDRRHVKTSKFANLRKVAKLIVKDICKSKYTSRQFFLSKLFHAQTFCSLKTCNSLFQCRQTSYLFSSTKLYFLINDRSLKEKYI